MVIGLIILGILAIMLFFGTLENYFNRIGLTSWFTFIIILALAIGAVVPEIRTDAFNIVVGGYIVPLVVFVVLIGFTAKYGNIIRTILSTLAVVGITALLRYLLSPTSTSLVYAFSIALGFIGGGLAFLVAGERIGTLTAVFGGAVIGDTLAVTIFQTGTTLVLGGNGLFDGLIIASVFGILALELVNAMRKFTTNTKLKRQLDMESGEDMTITHAEIDSENEENKNTEDEHSPEAGQS